MQILGKSLITILIFSLSLFATSFSSSKEILESKIYFDNTKTFYCSNPYEIRKIKSRYKPFIIPSKEHYTPRNEYTKKGKINVRAKRVEWEHVMPAHNFGRQLECWKRGGRKECQKDTIFQVMEADMHNLVPAIGEINGDRSNYRFGVDLPKKKQYGQCDFEVDFKNKIAYPKEDIRGDIARIYFYMSDTYKIKLSKAQRAMMEVWTKEDPVDDWERLKNKRVYDIQGTYNKFVEELTDKKEEDVYDNSYCKDEEEINKWNTIVFNNQDNHQIQALHALWLGLCAKVETKQITTNMAQEIFERARSTLLELNQLYSEDDNSTSEM